MENTLIIVFVIILFVWALFWKGYSVWTSARMGHKRWFIALIIFNTFGILDIIYLQFVAKKTTADVAKLFKVKI